MRLLFVGLGGVGQRHLRNCLKIYPEAEYILLERGV